MANNKWQQAVDRFKPKTRYHESAWSAACKRFGVSLKESDDTEIKPLDHSERAVAELLAQYGGVSGPAFINLLRSKGFKIVAPDEYQNDVDKNQSVAVTPNGKEASSASSFPQNTRTKESNIVDHFLGQMKFLESYSEESNPTRFRCILIQEGLGNFGDAYYYTRQAIESAVAVFEGKKIYADHPDAIEEKSRPERSVKDVLGHFENVRLEESKDGRAMLTADVVVMPDEPYQWARALMRHSVEYSKKYPDKDFIGLSINARGDSTVVPMNEWVKEAKIPASSMEKVRQAQEHGIDQIRLVTSIREAISCDMVTEAGAGGRIINFIEGAK